MPGKLIAFFLACLSVVVFQSCRDNNPADPCDAGETRDCTCSDGRSGLATCLDDGAEWGDCWCQQADGDADSDADGDDDFDPEDADPEDADPEDADPEDADPDPIYDLEPDRLHQDIEHIRDERLINALNIRVRDHESLGYEDARHLIFTELDIRGGLLECVYTGRTVRPDGTHQPGDLNTEHSWPRSDGANTEPAESDLHHLFPTDSRSNSRRGNHPFGETGCSGSACTWAEGGSELGTIAGSTLTVFEVRPESRGDIARAHFYFSVRYEMPIPETEERFLREWHVQDRVSEDELDRNDDIEAYQDNRNPFVDRPDFVHQISDF